MKITRKMLLIIVAILGFILIAYGVLQYLTGFTLGESGDKYVSNIIIFSALGIFLYHRKLLKDEKLAKEAAEEEKQDSRDDDET